MAGDAHAPGDGTTPARGPTPWDARYAEDGHRYGVEPNDFLVSVADRIPAGPVLCLAEGEGRNAVFLAARGHPLLAVDSSAVGLAKAEGLARERGTAIQTVVQDLATFIIEPARHAAIVSIFAHVPAEVRVPLHAAAVRGLAPGGVFVLEAYTPAQLGRGTGGPPVRELMMTRDELVRELAGLDFEIARECRREIVEGTLHGGEGEVVQILARKPTRAPRS